MLHVLYKMGKVEGMSSDMIDDQMPTDLKPVCRCVLCIREAMSGLDAAVARREGADPDQVTGVVCGLRAKPTSAPGLIPDWLLANGYEWTPCGRRLQLSER